MNDTITILTSDSPPVALTASRAVLSVNSKVFADMLSLPSSSSQDNSVTVAETEQEMGVFLAVLAGEGGNKGGVLEKLDEIEWEKLAELGDKYDSQVIRQVIETRICRKLEAKSIYAPLHLFTLATCVNSHELLARTANPALGALKTQARFGAKQGWKDRLVGTVSPLQDHDPLDPLTSVAIVKTQYSVTRKALAFELFHSAALVARPSSSNTPKDPAYLRILGTSLRDFHVSQEYWNLQDLWTDECQTHGWASWKHGAESLVRAWRDAPSFPYGYVILQATA
ncbi:hypothetical protein JCM11641_005265 [Rhodosporidiobolus odoratus]